MAEETDTAPEDLGAPIAYLALPDGTAVYDRSGESVGEVAHVLADDQEDIFHGLILTTPRGHRFARPDQVDGLYERGVIVAVPAAELAEPNAEADEESLLKRAWNWLISPK
ncbi:PRC-barrel domain-containing protein [Mangrovihabitans endophyticus]|uniref:PRC-barrel domain-containing protein n=1 Tax=Mangrovihabitans endophyticus TaxID=1751298 RepID=A0A8J3C309_9ACTN|nr:PRC-barrel domain-containing protein [Mangrovihabitans endophyticus]GGL02165.1 hypothetical protein GCM10012284_40870 [Mangrovihabitans endophyticus]